MPTPQREASTTMTLRHLLICAACATFMPLAHASNSAEMCISSNSTQNGVAVHNGCDTNVFILWCGELKYSDSHSTQRQNLVSRVVQQQCLHLVLRSTISTLLKQRHCNVQLSNNLEKLFERLSII